MVDRKARKILLDTFWKSGWKDDRSISHSDFEYAKSMGLMFDPIKISHDDLVRKLISERDQIAIQAVGDAFLSSLSSRRLDLRSALGSFAFASRFPAHDRASSPHSIAPSGNENCEICGFCSYSSPQSEDLNVLNFERHKWGGVRHDDPLYVWFDLSQFKTAETLEPSESDHAIMREVVRISGNLPVDAGPAALEQNLSGVLKSNKDERRVLIEILSLCGILKPSHRTEYFEDFTIPSMRHHTGQHFNDWGYPAIWWRGADGVNGNAVQRFFPRLF